MALTINGQSPEARKVEGGKLVLAQGGDDSLTLQIGEDVDTASWASAFEEIVLADSGTKFRGWVEQRPETMGETEGRTVQVRGPWRWLDMTKYRQRYYVWNVEAEEFEVQERASGIAILNQAVTGTAGVTEPAPLGVQLKDLLDQVIDDHGAVIDYVQSDLNALTDALPEDRQVDQPVGSLIRRLMAWVPDITYKWDYSTTVPTLRFRPFSAGTSRTLDDEDIELDTASVNPRFDLLCKAVVIIYQYQDEISGRVVLVPDTAGPGGDAEDLGADYEETLTVQLRSASECASAEPVPEGIAASQHNWRSKLHIDAQFSAEGPRWTWGPGDLWGFDGRLDHYSEYTSVAQVVERDLATDTVRVTVGAKAQLALSEQIQLSRINRTRGESKGDCRNPPAPAAPSGNPLEPVAIEGTAEVVVMAGYVNGEYTANVELGEMSGSGEIWVEATTDSEGEVTSFSIEIGGSVPADDETHAHHPLGHYEVVEGLVTISGPHLGGNLTHARCRDHFSAEPVYTHRWGSDT